MSFDTDSLCACFSKKTDQTRVSQIDLDYHAPLRVKGSFINKKMFQITEQKILYLV